MLAFPITDDFDLISFLKIFKTNVLIVEDDPLFKPIMTHILQAVDKNLQVHWTKSGEAAIRSLKANNYGLVIADYSLKGQTSGLDLFRYCREKHPELPFLLMSGLDQRLIEKNANQHSHKPPPFLQKPFLNKDCQKLLLELLKRNG